MKNWSSLVDTVFRYMAAGGLAVFAAWRLLPLGDQIGLFRDVVDTPLHALREDTALRIILTLLLVCPAWWATDWLLKSRTKTALINVAALIVVQWFQSSQW